MWPARLKVQVNYVSLDAREDHFLSLSLSLSSLSLFRPPPFLLSLIYTDVVQQFGIESILIYNALLLKKRVAVYASSVNTLLKTCRFARRYKLVVYMYTLT